MGETAVMAPGALTATASRYLTLSISDVECAVGIDRVREVVRYVKTRAAPDAPAWIAGLMKLRDDVVPVVDLAVKFGLPARPLEQTACIVVVDLDRAGRIAALGIVANGVHRVVDLPDDDIEAPAPFGTRVRLDFLLGMGRLDKDIVLLLDVDGLLARDELSKVATVVDSVGFGRDGSMSV
ncbi:MAG: purine-binding chemotaxis protein CheW [Vicinamibacteria bacterium]|nr:purine-binding chemotaxis protein CheW [Vicinamibacteria bacterium]